MSFFFRSIITRSSRAIKSKFKLTKTEYDIYEQEIRNKTNKFDQTKKNINESNFDSYLREMKKNQNPINW